MKFFPRLLIRAITDPKYDGHKVILSNLNWVTGASQISKKLQECGKIVDIRFMMNKNTPTHNGLAFVEFEDAQALRKALTLNDLNIDGKKVYVKKCIRK